MDSSLNAFIMIHPKRQRKNPNPARFATPTTFIAFGNNQPKEAAGDSTTLENSIPKNDSELQLEKTNPSLNVIPTSFNAFGNTKPKGSIKSHLKRKRKNRNGSRNVTPTTVNASGNTNSEEAAGDPSLENSNVCLSVIPTTFNASGNTKRKGKKTTKRCKNLACKAILKREDIFCKSCSCCICHKCDDYNKDPNIWLTCKSDPPFEGESCGFSCHLNCAFKTDKSGLKEGDINVDGCFSCVSCRKRNGLLDCLKKTLTIAKETKSVNVLCSRLLFAQKLLKGVDKYREVSETVEKAVESLEAEFNGGPLSDLPSLMLRGIVDRLQSISQVKSHCCFALTLLEKQGSSKEVRVDVIKVSTKTSQEVAARPQALETEGKRLSLKTNGPEKLDEESLELTECIRMIRRLECLGLIKKDLREKFLTWYTLKATIKEKHIVNIYIDSFKDNLEDLTGQLLHTFSNRISRKRSDVSGGDGDGGGGGGGEGAFAAD